MKIVHLARRFFLSFSRAEPPAQDVVWARQQLLPGELMLWQRLALQDRRHSLLVARRFQQMATGAEREQIAGALLHDVGKVDCGLGTWMRALATIVGPRTRRFAHYHDHERIGAELLREAGSAGATIDLVLGRGPLAQALRDADDI